MTAKNKVIVILSTLVIVLVTLGIYKMLTFSLFDDPITNLEEIGVPNRDYKLRIYHVPSNATSQDYIQVRKIKDGHETVMGSFERYDSLISYSLTNTVLELRLKNTTSNRSKVDSVYLQLEK